MENDEHDEGNDDLNSYITIEETLKALLKAKSGKSPGFDKIPVEVLKNNSALYMLYNLFNQCFKSGKVPDAWSKGVISPNTQIIYCRPS